MNLLNISIFNDRLYNRLSRVEQVQNTAISRLLRRSILFVQNNPAIYE